jgi:nucleolar protein 58
MFSIIDYLYFIISVKLIDFQKFENMNEAVSSVSDLLEGKLSKDLKSFLKETFNKMEMTSEKLAVMESKLGII